LQFLGATMTYAVTPRAEVLVSSDCLALAKGLIAEGRVRDALVAALKGSFELQELHQQQKTDRPSWSGGASGGARSSGADDAGALVHTAYLQLREDPWLMLALDEAAVAGDSPTGGDAAVKKAYRRAALELHPDKAPWAAGTDAFACLHAAYERLCSAKAGAAFVEQRASERLAWQAAAAAGPRAAAAFERRQAEERRAQERAWHEAWLAQQQATYAAWEESDAAEAKQRAAAKLAAFRRAELVRSKSARASGHDKARAARHEEGKRAASLKLQRRFEAEAAACGHAMASLEAQRQALEEARKAARAQKNTGHQAWRLAKRGALVERRAAAPAEARGTSTVVEVAMAAAGAVVPGAKKKKTRGGDPVEAAAAAEPLSSSSSSSSRSSAWSRKPTVRAAPSKPAGHPGKRGGDVLLPGSGIVSAASGIGGEVGSGVGGGFGPDGAGGGEEWEELPPVTFRAPGPMGFTLVDRLDGAATTNSEVALAAPGGGSGGFGAASALAAESVPAAVLSFSAAVLQLECDATTKSNSGGDCRVGSGSGSSGACAAAALGVRPGDVLCGVNGRALGGLGFAEACAALGRAPFPRTLAFVRRRKEATRLPSPSRQVLQAPGAPSSAQHPAALSSVNPPAQAPAHGPSPSPGQLLPPLEKSPAGVAMSATPVGAVARSQRLPSI